MTGTRLIALLFALGAFSTLATAQVCDWAVDEGGTGDDEGRSIVVDGGGNTYSTGSFSGTVNFPCGTLVSSGGTDIYVAKYDGSGTCLWVTSAGGSGTDIGLGIALSASGDVYVTGQFSASATFGAATLVSAGGTDIFLARYDSAGTNLWARRVGGGPSLTQDDIGEDVTVDASGNVYLTGRFAGVSTFECGSVTSVSNWNAFFAKYDTAGTCLWNTTTTSSGSGSTYGRGIAVDSSGVVTVVGDYQFGRAQFPGLPSTTLGNAGISGAEGSYLAKLNATTGTVNSAFNIANNVQIVPFDVAVDAAGNTYTVGRLGVTSLGFGCATLISTGGTDVFVVKHSPSSACLWVKQGSGSTGDDAGLDISLDGADHLYVSGYFDSQISFDAETLSGTGPGRDGFVAKLATATGNLAWLAVAGSGSAENTGHGVTSDAITAWVTGGFGGSASFPCAALASNGSSDIFIARYRVPQIPAMTEWGMLALACIVLLVLTRRIARASPAG